MTSTTHSRVDLAVEQLDVALELFLKKRSYVAALTLAGAAEEILGKALSLQGARTILDQWYLNMAFVDNINEPISSLAYASKINRDRNSVKHMQSLDQITIDADLLESAMWMLYRACANYEWLNLPTTKRMRSFDRWFMRYVV
jgi:hypothetical protein